MKPKLVILSVMFTIISLAQILGAQTLSMRFLSDTGTENVNFRQADTFGFSVRVHGECPWLRKWLLISHILDAKGRALPTSSQ